MARESRLSAAWPAFAHKLATALEKLDEDQFLILSLKRSHRFVQFAAQGAYGMRMETTSDSYLDKTRRLDELQVSGLLDAGWHVPTGSPANSTPVDDPDGSPNFFVDFPAPVSFAATANLAVRTLAEILRVPHPGCLDYEAFDADGEAIALPELGLQRAKHAAAAAAQQQDVHQLLLAALKQATGIDDLDFEDDGDIKVRSGSALTFVRIVDDPPRVRIYSPLLRDVEESAGIYSRLNDINANESLMRFIFRNGVLYSVAEISALPFVGAHVAQAFTHFCAIAAGMGSLLQEELGGRTAFVESMPSLMKH